MAADLFKAFPGFPILLSVLLLLPAAGYGLQRRPAGLALRLMAAAVAATAVLALALAFANLLVPDYVDNVEPAVVGGAWVWWHGGTLYPLVGSAGSSELRGLLYGPLTFLLAGLAPVLLGPSITVSKLPPVLLFMGMVALTGFACRRAGAPARTSLIAAAAMTAVLGISEAPYWVRGDTVLMLIGALCTWLAARPAPLAWQRAILLGLLAGSASAVKLHGAAYAAPACLLAVLDAAGWGTGRPIAWGRAGWGRAAAAAALIAAAALAAATWLFLLPGVTLDGYAFYLGLAAHHGFSAQLFLGNLTLLLAVCVPLLVLARDRPGRLAPRWRVLAGAAFGCASLVAVIAGKPGAGYPHLLPFLPYAALVLSRLLAERPAIAGSLSLRLPALGALFCLAFCVPVLVRAATFAGRGEAFAVIAAANRQVRSVLAQHPGEVVAVGYGGGSFLDLRLSYLRVLPVFGGNPLLYDATAMDDLWQGGVDRTLALRQIAQCGVRLWLVPGDTPFTIGDFYGGSTFDPAFRTRFEARYQRQDSDGPLRLWVCRPAGAP